jgi:hydroxymethylbilane synthase
MTDETVTLGSRTSDLALWQAERIADRIRAERPDADVDIVGMETLGDRLRDQPVPEIGGKGLFTEELEQALLAGEIDMAVHSLKDLPTELPEGLTWAGAPARSTATDALVSHRWTSLDELPERPTIATGSRRRRAQMRQKRPEARFENLRGNIGTRLEKLREHDWDGIVMATVALERLERSEPIAAELDPTLHVPAVSQGALGVEIAEARDDMQQLAEAISDDATVTACSAERHFLRRLEGGCSVPIGGYCRRESGEWTFYGWVGDVEGTTVLRERASGDDPLAMADAMADDFIERGAREILQA